MAQPCGRDRVADAVEQAEFVGRDDLEHRVPPRRLAVGVDDGRDRPGAAAPQARAAAAQPVRRRWIARRRRPRCACSTASDASGIEREKPLAVGELDDVEHQAVGIGHRVAAQDVHPERRQHAADVGEQHRLVERDHGELPRGIGRLEPQVDFVGMDVARQPDVLVDGAAIEQLQVAPRQALEKAGHFAGVEIGRPARDAFGGGRLGALDQIVAVLQRQVVVGVDVEPPEQLLFPPGQRLGADRLDVGERHQAQQLQPLLGADQRGELADDLRILGVAPERHLRHPQVMADEEQDGVARAVGQPPTRRAAAPPGGRFRPRGRRRPPCRRRAAAARGRAARGDLGEAIRAAIDAKRWRCSGASASRSRVRMVSSVCSSTVYLW